MSDIGKAANFAVPESVSADFAQPGGSSGWRLVARPMALSDGSWFGRPLRLVSSLQPLASARPDSP
jgi:hypothetical protein